MDKAEVRRLFRRRQVSEEISLQVLKEALKCELLLRAPLILTYMPLPDEIDLRGLLRLEGRFALPYIENGKVMRFALYKGKTVRGALGIREPEEKCECEYPDGTIALIPALAFTKEGYRVGRGAGFYDRFLSEHRSIYKIGVIPSERIVEVEDMAAHDIPMDALLTEKGLLPALRS